jgi:hypothetical protein
MRTSLHAREAYALSESFLQICHDVSDVLRPSRPASIHRLNEAAFATVHFVIHSHRRRKKARTWRIERALAAATAAELVLRRLLQVDGHRALVSAGLEICERLQCALREELGP